MTNEIVGYTYQSERFCPEYLATSARSDWRMWPGVPYTTYETDKPVTPEDAANGIRAWREIYSADHAKITFLPVFGSPEIAIKKYLRDTLEKHLDGTAEWWQIDRSDEASFDNDDFPKVVTLQQVLDDENNSLAPRISVRCDVCGIGF